MENEPTIKDVHQTLLDYIRGDVAWKERAEPVIRMGLSLQGAWRFFGFLAGFAAGATAILGMAKYAWVLFTDVKHRQ